MSLVHRSVHLTTPFTLAAMREIKSWLMDMDGVLVHENQALPGAPSSSAG